MRAPIVQTEVEELMAVLGGQLEEGAEVYAKLAEERAVAEADYKERYHTALVRQADSQYDHGLKFTASQKEARAALVAKEELRRFKLLEAVRRRRSSF